MINCGSLLTSVSFSKIIKGDIYINSCEEIV